MKKVVYVADIDQDIDDIIAIDYLNETGCLNYVVLDTEPKTQTAIERIKELQMKGIVVEHSIRNGEELLFVGGSLKKVSLFLQEKKENKIKILVMNGGFVGSNIVEKDKQLMKFKGEQFVRTYNFNLDVESTEYVLKSKQIDGIYLIGKNVCHSGKNTKIDIWKELDFLKKYELSDKKRLHDLLMVDEGLKIINGKEDESRLVYKKVNVIKLNEEEQSNKTKWGSELSEESHTFAAIDWLI